MRDLVREVSITAKNASLAFGFLPSRRHVLADATSWHANLVKVLCRAANLRSPHEVCHGIRLGTQLPDLPHLMHPVRIALVKGDYVWWAQQFSSLSRHASNYEYAAVFVQYEKEVYSGRFRQELLALGFPVSGPPVSKP